MTNTTTDILAGAGWCPRTFRRLVARGTAHLADAEDTATPDGDRAVGRILALGNIAAAEDHAFGLGSKSPVPVGAIIAARKSLERGDFAAALDSMRRIERAVSHAFPLTAEQSH